MGSHENDFRSWDEKAELPPEFIEELKEFGLFGLVIPEAHGGLGFGAGAYSRTLAGDRASTTRRSPSPIGAHSSIGMRGLLLFGTDEQKARYYPEARHRRDDRRLLPDRAGLGLRRRLDQDQRRQGRRRLGAQRQKLWITNGGIADFFTVFAKTDGADERGKLTAFIVTRDMAGVSTGPHEDKMGIRASSTTTVTFDNVRVPGQTTCSARRARASRSP